MSEEIVQKSMRSGAEITEIVNNAVNEVIVLFGKEMSDRDKEMLMSVINDKGTHPVVRTLYLRQIKESRGVSENLIGYINQVLLTIKQKLTPVEIEEFRTPFGGGFLDEIL